MDNKEENQFIEEILDHFKEKISEENLEIFKILTIQLSRIFDKLKEDMGYIDSINDGSKSPEKSPENDFLSRNLKTIRIQSKDLYKSQFKLQSYKNSRLTNEKRFLNLLTKASKTIRTPEKLIKPSYDFENCVSELDKLNHDKSINNLNYLNQKIISSTSEKNKKQSFHSIGIGCSGEDNMYNEINFSDKSQQIFPDEFKYNDVGTTYSCKEYLFQDASMQASPITSNIDVISDTGHKFTQVDFELQSPTKNREIQMLPQINQGSQTLNIFMHEKFTQMEPFSSPEM